MDKYKIWIMYVTSFLLHKNNPDKVYANGETDPLYQTFSYCIKNVPFEYVFYTDVHYSHITCNLTNPTPLN